MRPDPWKNRVNVDGNVVCGQSLFTQHWWNPPECFRYAPFADADTICRTWVSARLCTAQELAKDAAKGTGCGDKGFDYKLIWTSDACKTPGGKAGHIASRGSGTGAGPRPDTVCFESGANLAVRCCADADCSPSQPPSKLLLTGTKVGENRANAVVGTLKVTDADLPDDTHTYTLLQGNGHFALKGTNLMTKAAALDYETDGEQITVKIRVTDSTKKHLDVTFNITVEDANDAPLLRTTALRVAENNKAGKVAELDVYDDDTLTNKPWLAGRKPQTVRLELTTDGPFKLKGTELHADPLDHETQASYSLSVRVADSSRPAGAVTGKVLLVVGDVDEPPPVVTTSGMQIPEVSPGTATKVGSVVGTLSFYDEDIDITPTVRMSDPRSSFFSIKLDKCSKAQGKNGPKKLAPAKTYHYCRANVVVDKPFKYIHGPKIRCEVWFDAAGTNAFAFDVTIINTNEAPTRAWLASPFVKEDIRVGELVSEIYSDDPDFPLDTITYQLDTAGQKTFRVVGSELVVKDAALIDFEARRTLTMSITAKDKGGLTVVSAINISIVDVNEAPSEIRLERAEVPETARTGFTVGKITVVDPDGARQHHRCKVASAGPDTAPFKVTAGKLLVSGDTLDYERKPAYKQVQITCVDDGAPSLSRTQAFDINVTNVNEVPTAILLSGTSVEENAPPGTPVGLLTATDPDNAGAVDAQQGFEYRITSCSRVACPFAVEQSAIVTTTVLNHETTQRYTLYVQVTDADAATFTAPFDVTVVDTNDVPTRVLLSSAGVKENVYGAFVGQLRTIDEDNTYERRQEHTYSIVDDDQTDGSMFVIDGNYLALAADAVANYEQSTVLRVRIESEDNGLPLPRSVSAVFDVNVTDVNEISDAVLVLGRTTKPAKAISSLYVAESATEGSVLGTLVLPDPDNRQSGGGTSGDPTPGYRCSVRRMSTLSGAATVTAISVANGTQLVLEKSELDFESVDNSGYLLEVGCTDGGSPPLQTVSNITLHVLNVNEPPRAELVSDHITYHTLVPGGTLYEVRVSEKVLLGALLGEVVVADPDNCAQLQCYPHQRHTLAQEPSSTLLQLVGSNIIARRLDFETRSTETVVVTVVDAGGLSTNLTIRVRVDDANEGPTGITLSGRNAVDTSNRGAQLVGSLAAVDPDRVSDYTFSVVAVLDPSKKAILTQPGPFVCAESQLFTSNGVQISPGLYTVTVQAVDESAPLNSMVATFNVRAVVKNIAPQDLEFSPKVIQLQENSRYGVGNASDVAMLSVVDANNPDQCQAQGNCQQVHRCRLSAAGCSSPLPQSCVDVFPSPFYVPKEGPLRVSVNATHGVFDFESVNRYQLTVVCVDDGVPPLSVVKMLPIEILDGNDVPSSVKLLTATGRQPGIPENAKDGFVVGVLHSNDQDEGQQLMYAIADDRAPFGIQGNQLVVQRSPSSTPLDYEKNPALSVQIRVTDSGKPALSSTENIVVQMRDSNEAPQQIKLLCGCAPSPCLNSGGCVPIGIDGLEYRCSCRHGFLGSNCETSPNPSAPPSATPANKCLDLPPGTEAGTKLARVRVVDPDKGDSHTFQLDGPGTAHVSLVDGVLILLDTLGPQDGSKALSLSATDSGGLSLTYGSSLTQSLCFKRHGQCSQHATCTIVEGSPICACAVGFTGDGRSCVPDFNPPDGLCDDAPCPSPRVCTHAATGPTCACRRGISGRDCQERVVHPCSTVPCYNGATCTASKLTAAPALLPARCACKVGTFGSSCQFRDGQCTNTSCTARSEVCLALQEEPPRVTEAGSAPDAGPPHSCAALSQLATIVAVPQRECTLEGTAALEEQFVSSFCSQPKPSLIRGHADLLEHCLAAVVGANLTVYVPSGDVRGAFGPEQQPTTAVNHSDQQLLYVAVYDENRLLWSASQLDARIESVCDAPIQPAAADTVLRCCRVFQRTQMFMSQRKLATTVNRTGPFTSTPQDEVLESTAEESKKKSLGTAIIVSGAIFGAAVVIILIALAVRRHRRVR